MKNFDYLKNHEHLADLYADCLKAKYGISHRYIFCVFTHRFLRYFDLQVT